MAYISYRCAIIFVLSIIQNEAAKLLVFLPVPMLSHQQVTTPFIQELATRGHELIILTPFPMYPKGQMPENVKQIDMERTSFETWKEKYVNKNLDHRHGQQAIIKGLITGITSVVEEQLKVAEVQELINGYGSEYFDLILTEGVARVATIMSHKFKGPLVELNTMGALAFNSRVHGIPTHSIYFPELLGYQFDSATLWNILYSMIYNLSLDTMICDEVLENEEKVLKTIFGPEVPKYEELYRKSQVLFLNIHPMDVPSNVIFLGGLQLKPPGSLSKDLETTLNSSVNGVMYMSFGTTMTPSQMPVERVQIFMNVFSKLPYDVLCYWARNETLKISNNVKLFKWLPQADLLRHPKVKLFITQGGLQSTDEAIEAGVPVVGVSVIADQPYNVKKYVQLKIGLKIDISTVDEDTLLKTIQTVIKDPSYKTNMLRLRTQIYDRPHSALARAVWWTEYVARHRGARHLHSPLATVTWTEYFMLDVVTMLIGVILANVLMVYVVIRWCFKWIVRNINRLTGNLKFKAHLQ